MYKSLKILADSIKSSIRSCFLLISIIAKNKKKTNLQSENLNSFWFEMGWFKSID